MHTYEGLDAPAAHSVNRAERDFEQAWFRGIAVEKRRPFALLRANRDAGGTESGCVDALLCIR
jgi:hypothetical protein